MKLRIEKLCIWVEFGFEYVVGVGWWRCGNKIPSLLNSWQWLSYTKTYYDGWWWAIRIGPFFVSRGPYW